MTEQYIHWPSSAQYPATSGAGNQLHPTSDYAVADTATTVHSLKGSTWERVSDETMTAIGQAVATVIDSTNVAAASGDFEVSLDRIAPSAEYTQAKTEVLQEVWVQDCHRRAGYVPPGHNGHAGGQLDHG
ncbi:hypothetical protein [Actinomyces procaprae]|uniref:hypothetical protein n=1 Tax=Actinomyces procaprae TaxID=2560010 RepID=UPI0010A25AC2|nr:hypothetical protein [Actinomyces procaprae]